MTEPPLRLAVLGAGFAALRAARELRRRAPAATVTLVAPRAEFVYLPSLMWIPVGLRRGSELVLPLDRFLARQRIGFHAATVTGLADGGRTVLTSAGNLANDGLIVASGGRFLRGMPGIEHALTLCEGVEAAERIGQRLAAMDGGHIAVGFGGNPKEPSAMRGGPMFELLFGIDCWLRRRGLRDRFTLTFFNAAAEPGKRLGDAAVKRLMTEMRRRGIGLRLGSPVKAFSPSAVTTEAGDIPADLILFMPGLTGPAWAEHSGLALSPGGLFQADDCCAAGAARHVFIAGDCGSYPGAGLDAQTGPHGRPSGPRRRREPARFPGREGAAKAAADGIDLRGRQPRRRDAGLS